MVIDQWSIKGHTNEWATIELTLSALFSAYGAQASSRGWRLRMRRPQRVIVIGRCAVAVTQLP